MHREQLHDNGSIRYLAETIPPQDPDRDTYLTNNTGCCWAIAVLFVLKFMAVGQRQCDADFMADSAVQELTLELLQSNWALLDPKEVDKRKNNIVKEYKKVSVLNPNGEFDSARFFLDALAVGLPSIGSEWCLRWDCTSCDWQAQSRCRIDRPEATILVEGALGARIQERIGVAVGQNSLHTALRTVFEGALDGTAKRPVACTQCLQGQLRTRFALCTGQPSNVLVIEGLQFEDDYMDAGALTVVVESKDGNAARAQWRLTGLVGYRSSHYTAFLFHYGKADRVESSSYFAAGIGETKSGSSRLSLAETRKRLKETVHGHQSNLFFFENLLLW